MNKFARAASCKIEKTVKNRDLDLKLPSTSLHFLQQLSLSIYYLRGGGNQFNWDRKSKPRCNGAAETPNGGPWINGGPGYTTNGNDMVAWPWTTCWALWISPGGRSCNGMLTWGGKTALPGPIRPIWGGAVNSIEAGGAAPIRPICGGGEYIMAPGGGWDKSGGYRGWKSKGLARYTRGSQKSSCSAPWWTSPAKERRRKCRLLWLMKSILRTPSKSGSLDPKSVKAL